MPSVSERMDTLWADIHQRMKPNGFPTEAEPTTLLESK